MKRFFDPTDIKLEVFADKEEDALSWLEQKKIILIAENPQADISFKEPQLFGNHEHGYKGVVYFHMTIK